MNFFFYIYRFIFKNISGILKNNIYLSDFFKKINNLEIKKKFTLGPMIPLNRPRGDETEEKKPKSDQGEDQARP